MAGRGRGVARGRLRLPARRQRDSPAGPAVAASARGRARPLPAVRPRPPTSGATTPGPAARWPAAWSTSCTSARSRRRAPWTPRSAGSATWCGSGVDFVELLPVNAFNGTHNWGYDGVLWYAVQEAYGGPAAYQRFVDACHQQGLGVIQDVVYNHLGPSGNYLPEFFPIFAEGGANTWGNSINLSGPDSDEVRRYVIDNALMWLRDMHVDGLRLDAVHALVDERATHVLEEMAQEVDKLSVAVGRPLTLIAESDLNDPRMVTPRVAGGLGPDRAVERRLPPRAALDPDRRGAGLLRRLRRGAGSAGWPRCSPAPSSTTAPGRASAAGTTAGRSTPRRCPAGSSSATCRTTTRSATARSATGSPRPSPPACSPSARRWC